MARQVTLVVEDGSVVEGANSFVSEERIVSYAAARGVTLPFDTDAEKDAVAILGISAMDYLWAQPWRGEVHTEGQTTPWPRKNTYVNPTFPEDAVPFAVLEAQLQLALLVKGGTSLMPASSGTGFLIKEKIGPIENVYSEKVGVGRNGFPIFPGISALLDPWLIPDATGMVPLLILSMGGPIAR